MSTMDSELLIVVEGKTDAMAIRAILGADLARRARVFAAQGRTSLVTVARNLFFHEGGPVLIVMDADTTTAPMVEEQKALTRAAVESLIPGIMNCGDRGVEVFAFVPEIEVIFFEAPPALELLLGEPVPPAAVEEGLLIPHKTLAALLARKGPLDKVTMLYTQLADPEMAHLIAQGTQATALRDTVTSILAPAVPTA
jgi:hypothetical protein